MKKTLTQLNREAINRSVRINREEFVKWLRRKIREDWGVKCGAYARGCPCCEAWKIYGEIAPKKTKNTKQ